MKLDPSKSVKSLPVTVLSGFLGAGKTSLLNHVLNNKTGLKVAVIVNDMSEVNVDAQNIAQQDVISRTEEKLVEMSNGCICCTLREDLMEEVQKLAQEGRFDYILIESSGISEPVPVAQTFSFIDEESGIDLSRWAHIDAMVTVVDAYNFFTHFGSDKTLEELQASDLEDDNRTLVNLLTDQIEFANVILLNKTDLVSEEDLGILRGVIHKLNPGARIHNSVRGQIDPKIILNTQLFDYDEAEQNAGWIRELNAPSHTPETEEYGIHSFVYRSRRPFHPQRLWNWIENEFPESMLRSKGLFWLVSRPDQVLMWGQAGGSIQADSAGTWWCTMSQAELDEDPHFQEEKSKLLENWDPVFGDRKNELVIIGREMEIQEITEELDACLCTEWELNTLEWEEGFKDEWPVPTLEYFDEACEIDPQA